jgi:hypothetical protein
MLLKNIEGVNFEKAGIKGINVNLEGTPLRNNL